MIEDAVEEGLSVPVHRIAAGKPRPVGSQVPEEASFRVRLDPEDVPVAVAERGDPIRRPARIPWIRSSLPLIVNEPEDDLIVLREFLQHLRLAVFGEEQLSFRVSGNEGHDFRALQRLREGARAAIVEPEETRTALVVPGVVRGEDRLGRLGHRAAKGGKEARLHEDLEAVAHAEDGLARLDEFRQVAREAAPKAGGEDCPRADIVACRESTRNHEDVKVLEGPLQFARSVSGELLQVDLLRLRAEVAEERDGFVLAVRPFNQQDGNADILSLHETTTCFGIVSLHAFRIEGSESDVHCFP